ncbi:MAG: flagellar hook-basal body complex protein FliE [Terricaulis sp.]
MTDIAAITAAQSALPHPTAPPLINANAADTDFAQMLHDGIAGVQTRLDHADQMVRAFTLDDAVPVHQVTVALEQARISVELALQVRQRLVDGFREIMNMQL